MQNAVGIVAVVVVPQHVCEPDRAITIAVNAAVAIVPLVLLAFGAVGKIGHDLKHSLPAVMLRDVAAALLVCLVGETAFFGGVSYQFGEGFNGGLDDVHAD